MYTEAQLQQYFRHISFDPDKHGAGSLDYLAALQRAHLARVPFESVSLHYSKTRLLSLDLDDLFDKIVGNSRGGYCMEVNAFFGAVLRSLGFTVLSAGARVRGRDRFGGWDHMVNLVSVSDARHLVDVGYGAQDATRPVPLEDGVVFDNVPPRRGRLEYRALAQHSDPAQRAWVYSSQDGADEPWKEMYAFTETEFFPEDYEVMNLRTMTSPTSFFVQHVIAMRTEVDEDGANTVAIITMFRDYVKRRASPDHRRTGGSAQQPGHVVEELARLETEEDRAKALEKYFFITLAPSERRAIKGLSSEMKESS